jgi:protoporphyrinogen IX oxidase
VLAFFFGSAYVSQVIRRCVRDFQRLHLALMLWVKAFHIVFVASWFAGLFYLPRIFVNLAQVPAEQSAERERLLLMARKLFRFTTLLAVPAVALGLWLWLGYGIGRGPGNGWMHAKLALVLVVLGYHHGCGVLLKKFVAHTNRRSHVWYRWFNELPVLLLTAIVVLAVVKPF